MCGIAAVFSTAMSDDLRSSLTVMLDRARHRGPDGSGMVIGTHREINRESTAGTWGLGHVRLAILDLSDAGLQPMALADGQCWISYNGEVYNYLELAAELRALGHNFRTGTDTEVILAAFDQWGMDAPRRFRGMFALVGVDLRRSRAFAVRDRLGIKPLYFYRLADRVFVVSEPKQLTALTGFQPRLDPELAVDYLCEGLLGHEPDRSLWRNVQPLPAGHLIEWDLSSTPELGRATSFWEPDRSPLNMAWDDAVARTEEVFCRSVELRLRSDVAVGTCLSGGIDSSSIVGVAHRDFHASMKTFSVCNRHVGIDEQSYMDAVNQANACEPHKLFLDVDDAIRDFDQFVYQQDEPVFSLSQYGEYRVMQLARQAGVTVLLNGQGGDETLCGYRKFVFFYLKHLLREHRIGAGLRHVWDTLWRGDRQVLQFWQGVRYAPAWLVRRYDPMDDILRPSWRKLRRARWKEVMSSARTIHDHQWADLRLWSLPVLLRYQDRNSMAHGVEARVPMVDHEFVEFALRIPEDFFFRQGMTKRLLVEAMGDRLPESLRRRRTKLGFDTPQIHWMKGRLGEYFEQRVCASERIAEIVDLNAAQRAFVDFRRDRSSVPHFVLFRLACLAAWLDVFQMDVDPGR